MGFVDFVLYGLGFGLTTSFCTWMISHRAAFKRGLIAGLERGHHEGFDVGYQAAVCEMTFGAENEPLDNICCQTAEEIDYGYLVEDVPTATLFSRLKLERLNPQI